MLGSTRTTVQPSCRRGRSAPGYLPEISAAWIFFCVLLTGQPLFAQATRATPAAQAAVVTILQGKAIVIRGTSESDVLEGMRLLADDIVRTDSESFLRLEYADQSWLELGPQTELQLRSLGSRRARRPGLYLLHGWLKLEGKAGPDSAQGFAVPGSDVTDISGVLVVHLEAQSLIVFAERGTAQWTDRVPRSASAIPLKNGDFLVVDPNGPPKVQSRPTAQFVEALPRPYRDTLPARYSIYANRIVTPKEERSFSYSEAEPWLNGEPGIRRQFVATWRRRAREADFRDSLDRQMQLHPEWDRVLHPEKYEPPQPVEAVHPQPVGESSAGPVSDPK
jgi:hypothetical protein